MLVCLPKKEDKIGSAVKVTSQNIVQSDESGPLQDPFKEKPVNHALTALTAKRLENHHQFCVVSNNLLAVYYCDTDYSNYSDYSSKACKELFIYCPAYTLEMQKHKLPRISYPFYLIQNSNVFLNDD